jgi:hypothetical protein
MSELTVRKDNDGGKEMTLKRRYSPEEFQRLSKLIHPEERRYEFTNKPWTGEGFRHYHDPQIICIEHYMPRSRVLKIPVTRRPYHKPAA